VILLDNTRPVMRPSFDSHKAKLLTDMRCISEWVKRKIETDIRAILRPFLRLNQVQI
jgi:hypothetical protein